LNEEVNVPLSALNHWTYCSRRCGLIHLEGEFTNNLHTARGNAEHERVDRIEHETNRAGSRIEHALPVWCDRLGLIGKCDVVEFWPDGTIFPVEYKHGARKTWVNDDLQLAAQAVCLEEMLGRPVPRGAIYHATSRRRREVIVTPELKSLVEQTTAAIRSMLLSARLAAPVNDRRCRECSLKGICQPEAMAGQALLRERRQRLYDVDKS
jgi:CRISPR-associated exonuclease Cas4